MRWSQMFLPTQREIPGQAESASHRLLLRAGYVRQLMSGHYVMLPLGVRVRRKIADIIRQEMARIGGQEFLCPAMHPAELWQKTGRWTDMGDEMFRLVDRKGANVVLGMTHEEVFAWLALELGSYRSLPQIWFQVQTKFRDEARPKAGLLRTREFTMKDSYSFDLDQDGLDHSFELHGDAYRRIFTRLGIPFVPVEASSGTMGGSASVEFMSPCSAGEDDIVTCAACGYSANVERASSPVPAPPERPPSAVPEAFETPQVHTIQDLARPPYGVEPHRQIKTLVYVTDDKDETILVLLRGDHSLVEQKLVDATGGGSLRPAHTDEIRAALGARPGSLGAVGVTNVSVIADQALRGERDMVTGANRDDVHLRHVDVDRDISIDLWADLRAVADGEPCPRCGRPLRREPALEIGHIFKLGKKYAEALGVSVQDASAEERTITMGCYGIGLERAMAAIIESHHDDRGIIWPISVAPFDIAVVPVGDTDVTGPVADRLYDELTRSGLDTLLDDRPGRVGAKLKDVELIGIPYRLVVGPRSVAEGVVELTDRASGQTTRLPIDDASGHVAGVIAEAKANLQPGEETGPAAQGRSSSGSQ